MLRVCNNWQFIGLSISSAGTSSAAEQQFIVKMGRFTVILRWWFSVDNQLSYGIFFQIRGLV